MLLTWKSKFQRKGKWYFEPSDAGRLAGAQIKKHIEKHWVAPDYFYHLKQGGHVSALRTHLSSRYFARVDIENFFGSINQSRLTRCLNKKVNYLIAREWTKLSTVKAPTDNKKFIIPFGFVQSPILATLCLHESALGVCLKKLSTQSELKISVYVDDIIISSESEEVCLAALTSLTTAAERAKFKFNEMKWEGPAKSITAFNVELSQNSMELTPRRLLEFKNKLQTTNKPAVINGIVGYVSTICEKQAATLAL